MFRFVQVT